MNHLHHYLMENAPRFLPLLTIRTQAKELKTTTQAPFTSFGLVALCFREGK